jgi:putative tricarboxylic transport membrane protein
MTTQTPRDREPDSRVLRSSLDIGGGLFLLALAITGYVGAFSLPFGQLSGIGSGLLPKVVAVLVAVFGVVLVVQGLLFEGDKLEQWAVRGPLFVLAGVLVFAVTIRPLGLVIAGPLSVIVSALADRDTRPVEVAILAVVLTIVSGLLFKELLNLPIPFDPRGLVPEPVFHAYIGLKSAIGGAFAAVKSIFIR